MAASKNKLEFEISRLGSTEGNKCCWKNQGHLGICLTLYMETFTSTNSQDISKCEMHRQILVIIDGQNSKKGFKKKKCACSVEGVFQVLNFTACKDSKLVGSTWTNQI